MANPESKGLPDETLVSAMAVGDQAALKALNERYGNAVLMVARRILGDMADAEEVAADVLWQAWVNSSRFDRARGSVGAWLMMIARSRSIDRLRSRQARDPMRAAGVEADSQPGTPDPAIDLYGAQCRKIVGDAIRNLQENERAVLELAYFSDLSQSEIAVKIGMPLGTVKTRMRSALAKLRETLKGLRG